MISFDAGGADFSPSSRTLCNITAYDADVATVLENFEVEQVVNHFGISDLLDEIGEAAVRKHFNIEE
jgi:hypothetical protein